jgi:hypothetical protein
MRRASHTTLLCLSLSILMGTIVGIAHAKGEYSRRGFHVGASVLAAIPLWQDALRGELVTISPIGLLAEVKPSAGFDLRGGYRLHPRIAAEMGFTWIAPYQIEVPGAGSSEASTWMFYADSKIFILAERWQPYLLLGMGAYHLDYSFPIGLGRHSGTDFAPRIGGGLDYYINRHIGLSLEAVWVKGTRRLNERDFVTTALGAFYRF